MATGSTPSCSAVKQNGQPCNKSVGTVPSPDGPRCWSHQQRDQRRADPGMRCPVKRPRTPDDVQRIMDWALVRAAEGKMGSHQVNALSGMAKTWLIVHRNKLGPMFSAFQGVQEDMVTLLEVARPKAGCEESSQRGTLAADPEPGRIELSHEDALRALGVSTPGR